MVRTFSFFFRITLLPLLYRSMSLGGPSEELNPFHEDADPNEIYELIQLLGEGSYGSVYKGGTKY